MAADLIRAQGGYEIALTIVPSLESPESAIIEITQGKLHIETLTTTLDKAIDVFNHAAVHSEKYATALT